MSLLSPKERFEIQRALLKIGKQGPLAYGRYARPILKRPEFNKRRRKAGVSLRSLELA